MKTLMARVRVDCPDCYKHRSGWLAVEMATSEEVGNVSGRITIYLFSQKHISPAVRLKGTRATERHEDEWDRLCL